MDSCGFAPLLGVLVGATVAHASAPRDLSAVEGAARPDRLRADHVRRHDTRAVHVRGRLGRAELPAQAGHHPRQVDRSEARGHRASGRACRAARSIIDDKLVCAFSYGFRFNKIALGGCTPIEYMKKDGDTYPPQHAGPGRDARTAPQIVQPGRRVDGRLAAADADGGSGRRARCARPAAQELAACPRPCPRRSRRPSPIDGDQTLHGVGAARRSPGSRRPRSAQLEKLFADTNVVADARRRHRRRGDAESGPEEVRDGRLDRGPADPRRHVGGGDRHGVARRGRQGARVRPPDVPDRRDLRAGRRPRTSTPSSRRR